VAIDESSFSSKLRRIRFSIASTGLGRGLADVATLLLAYRPEHDRSFEQRFGTDTAGSVEPSQLGIADAAARDQTILYLPSPTRVTTWMFEHAPIRPHDYSFVYSSAAQPVEQMFARFPWLQRRRYEHSVLGNYDGLFYSN